MKKNYKKILITCFGLPNNSSEQSNNDPLLYANFLKKNKFQVEFLCISNSITSSTNEKNSKIYKKLNQTYKVNLIKIKNNKLSNLIQKLKILFSKKKVNFNLNDIDFIKIRKKITEKNPDLIINFSEITLIALYKLDYKVVNYAFLDREKIEKIKIKQFFKDINFTNILKIFNSFLFIITYKKIRNKIYSFPIANIYPGSDPPKYLGKKLILSMPLVNNNKFQEKERKIQKNNIQILMIGNNRSTIVIDGLYELSENLINDISNLQKKNKFKINIVGKFLPPKKILKKLNLDWIKFHGWIKNIDDFYNKSYILLAPNKVSIGVRTKILDAMRYGTPVLSYNSSNFNNSGFKNNENILMAKNSNEMKINIQKIIDNPELAKKISKKSKLLFKRRYNNEKNIKKTINKIFNLI